MALPETRGQNAYRDSWLFLLPVFVISVGYIAALISPAAWVFFFFLTLTPLARRSLLGREWIWEIASLFYFIFFIMDIFVFSRHLGTAITHLVSFLLISRCWVRTKARIIGQRLILVFVFWILIGSINNDVYFLYLSLFMTPALTASLMGFHVRLYEGDSRIPRLLPVGSMVISVLILPLSLGFFFLIPRYHLGYLAAWRLEVSNSISGLGEGVSLSDITRIKEDPSPAIKVQWLEPPLERNPDQWYWRALVYDSFTGREWFRTVGGIPRTTTSGPLGYGVYTGLDRRGQRVSYLVEPYTFLPSLVHLGEPLFIHYAGSILRISSSLELSHETYRPYRVVSQLLMTSDRRYRIREPEWSWVLKLYPYLQVPDDLRPLSRYLSSWGIPLRSGQATAEALETYLKSHYRYTTEIYSANQLNPLKEFLEKRKEGHCEYFASSMAILARLAGVPSRLVTGYHGGEPNARGVRIRQSFAHAWVEIYDPASQSWIGYDPTPAAEEIRIWRSLASFFKNLGGDIEAWWDEQIVLYSSYRQLEYLSAVGRFIALSWEKGREVLENLVIRGKHALTPVHGIGLLSLFFLIIMITAVLRYRGRFLKRNLFRGIQSPIPEFRRLMRWVEKKFGVRDGSRTWSEYLEDIRSRDPHTAERLQGLVTWYYRLRYTSKSHGREIHRFVQAVHAAQEDLKRKNPNIGNRGEHHGGWYNFKKDSLNRNK